MAENVPAIEENIRSPGCKLSDVKVLLGSHAHFGDQNYGGTFAPGKVGHILHDGSRVALGRVTMQAVPTAGHTHGCTTRLTTVMRDRKVRPVVLPGSPSVAGNIPVGNRAYPGIAAGHRASFRRMATIHADLVLPAHPERADVLGRRGAARIVPDLLSKMVADAKAAFETELAKQRVAAHL